MHLGIPQIDPHDPDNFVGKPVDYAARLSDYATSGQILASRSVVAAYHPTDVHHILTAGDHVFSRHTIVFTVLTEVFSSNEGIGFEMRVASQLFRMDEFFTWVLSFFVFALFLEKVVLQRYENKFFRWRAEVGR